MCGLFAYLSETTAIDQGQIGRAIEALRPRGPDSEGWWVGAQGRLALAHTRLSVVSPADGAQPICNESGDIVAVVNGEFYGHEAIRERLLAAGYRFKTGSDSEILVHLYEAHGERCVEHLRGEFAFVLWDARRARLLAARDRFGIKPLVYGWHDGAMYLASDAKTLFAAGLSPRWSSAGVYAQLFAYLPSDGTLFHGIRQLPPGWLLTTDGRSSVTRPYWDLDYPCVDELRQPTSVDALVDRFAEVFHESVRLRLRGDVAVSCMLSGGIDSAAVLAACRSADGRPCPDSFTARFDDEQFDDGPAAASVAAHVGSPWHEIRLDEQQLFAHLPAAVAAGEMPALNGHAVGRYLLARSISHAGYRVALAGDGADDILGGYIYAMMDAQVSTGAPVASTPKLLHGVAAQLGFVPAWLRTAAISRSPFYALLSKDFSAQHAATDPYSDLIRSCASTSLQGRLPLHQSLYLWCKSILPNYALVGERLEMANGVEVRLPFLDHHLFGVIRHLPSTLLVQQGEQKRVLRQALKRVLPTAMVERPKRPFAARPSSVRQSSPLVEMTLSLIEQRDALPPFLDVRAVRSLLVTLPQLARGTLSKIDPLVHMIACLCLMQRHFKCAL